MQQLLHLLESAGEDGGPHLRPTTATSGGERRERRERSEREKGEREGRKGRVGREERERGEIIEKKKERD